MKKNKRLNPRKILEKPVYRAILNILENSEDKKIKFCHLKYTLVNKEYPRIKDKMENFFINMKDERLITTISDNIGKIKNEIQKEFFQRILEELKSNPLYKNKFLKPEKKLGSESSLRDKLYELIELGLIEKIPDKKGYPYYKITEKGRINYTRWKIHSTIDSWIRDDYNELKNFHDKIIKEQIKKYGIIKE